MDLKYKIVRSANRRKLTITVERDRSVIVHAPINTPDEKINQVIESKRHWIYDKIHHSQKYSDLPHPPGKEMVNGESALYLGRSYRIETVQNDFGEIRFNQKFMVPVDKTGKMRRAFRDWYIIRAKEKILSRASYHARKLGVEYTNAKIVDNLYRWGSCTVKNNVNFNWRLIKAPMFVIDYVIVHELAHLLEPNHTPKFWNIVKTQIPNVEKSKQWLKNNGQLLEQPI